uniref:Uncharacterized protein n=2 Tax=Oryza sativa subsp. japonica TaxID=39947 RepID=Q84T37_ORYSJ|nr:hypothetical protein [Oryza sativa Japonica Group]ABF96936.1 hypothetical protein LOC_Os03g33450 [Oryza sativa Japonica Group]
MAWAAARAASDGGDQQRQTAHRTAASAEGDGKRAESGGAYGREGRRKEREFSPWGWPAREGPLPFHNQCGTIQQSPTSHIGVPQPFTAPSPFHHGPSGEANGGGGPSGGWSWAVGGGARGDRRGSGGGTGEGGEKKENSGGEYGGAL